jgi:murein DD-endopeptidase MepM/ murein hydrolase activator NlpD
MSVHTGVDLDAPRGTPVLAAASGLVVWVGFGLYGGAPDPRDPYGLAIALQHDFGYQGKTLFTVYAHLQDSRVWLGQTVAAGQEIGSVGDTGNANGVHLHFEVRLGEDEYFATRNPELWMAPPEGWGVLAGRVLDTSGHPLAEQLIQIQSLDTRKRWEAWSYALSTVHADDVYDEDFVISDLPAGPYQVEIDFLGRPYTAQLLVRPGQTNLLTFRGRAGFKIESPPVSTPGAVPPYR